MTIIDQISFILGGGAVRRFHVVPTIHPNSVAHHSFGVAWLCYLLSETEPRAQLLLAALAHDLAEQEIGDVPSPTKRGLGVTEHLDQLEANLCRENGAWFQTTPEERAILGLADRLDGMLWCVQERRLGNTNMSLVFWRYADYVHADSLTLHQHKVYHSIVELWEMANA